MINPSPGGIGANAAQAVKKFFQKKFPYNSSRIYSDVERQELEHRFKKWKVITGVLVITYLMAFIIIWGYVLQQIHQFLYSSFTTAPSIFFPENLYAFALINGVFLSMTTLGFVIEGTIRLFFGSTDYKEFVDFNNHTEGYDNHKAMLLLAKTGGVLTLISLVFTFSARIIAKEDTVIINSFLSVTTNEYAYKDVNSIIYFLNSENREGKINKDLHYKLYWRNGDTFNLNKYFTGATEAEPFIRLLSERSGILVDTAVVEPY